MKTILVTGGAGFIGSHLCELLINKGYQLCILDSMNDYYNPEYKKENLNAILAHAGNVSRPKFYKLDIRNKDELNNIFFENNIDIVIHLAAYAGVRPSIENSLLYTEVNINGTLNILDCMKQHNVKKLIFASSSSVYGNNKIVPFSENDIVDFPISPYAATKKAGELLCHTYHHLYHIDIACLRFFTVYGPRQRPDLAIYKFTDLMMRNQPVPFYGDGSSRRDYTFITDILDGIYKSLSWIESDENLFEVFNLGESTTISLAEMVQAIESATGKKAMLNHLPKQAGDVDITYANITKAKTLLNYTPKTHFQSGINQFVEWFKYNRLN